jgi:hypothetical protein
MMTAFQTGKVMSLSRDQEALMDAVLDNNQRKVNLLLKKGVNPDFTDENDSTPLSEAIGHGNLAMVKALVAAGADINRPSGYANELPLDQADSAVDAGYSPYYPSPDKSSTKIIEFLEQKGAQSSDPARLSSGQRGLLDAASDGDLRKVKSLLAKGIDPDFQDAQQDTPLARAVRSGSGSVVRALVDAGADIDCPNSVGETPLELARYLGEDAIAQYLESQGAAGAAAPPSTGGGARASATFQQSARKTSSGGSRGRSVGFRDDFDDYYDDDYDAPSRNHKSPQSAKNKKPESAASANAPAKPVFREDTLKDVFNPKSWVGKTAEMEKLWNEVPKRLQKKFDFAASLAEARRETLRQNTQGAPKLAARKTVAPPPQAGTKADAPAAETPPVKPAEPPKPPAP